MSNGQIKGFNPEQTAERIVQWIKDYFKENAAFVFSAAFSLK